MEKKISEDLAGRETALTSFPPTTVENLTFTIMAEKEERPHREVHQTGGANDLGNESLTHIARYDCGRLLDSIYQKASCWLVLGQLHPNDWINQG